ncbi:unnamed protein product [Nesidiocoris tenuis]|uniref:Uncharacterized protein n=1 Tax=Nesidiocoris tenuis TaxID=355587 RepID=A0A6H5H4A3_9HEMI|nr:unnamed protein product [Nesidiocoris tenuis]
MDPPAAADRAFQVGRLRSTPGQQRRGRTLTIKHFASRGRRPRKGKSYASGEPDFSPVSHLRHPSIRRLFGTFPSLARLPPSEGSTFARRKASILTSSPTQRPENDEASYYQREMTTKSPPFEPVPNRCRFSGVKYSMPPPHVYLTLQVRRCLKRNVQDKHNLSHNNPCHPNSRSTPAFWYLPSGPRISSLTKAPQPLTDSTDKCTESTSFHILILLRPKHVLNFVGPFHNFYHANRCGSNERTRWPMQNRKEYEGRRVRSDRSRGTERLGAARIMRADRACTALAPLHEARSCTRYKEPIMTKKSDQLGDWDYRPSRGGSVTRRRSSRVQIIECGDHLYLRGAAVESHDLPRRSRKISKETTAYYILRLRGIFLQGEGSGKTSFLIRKVIITSHTKKRNSQKCCNHVLETNGSNDDRAVSTGLTRTQEAKLCEGPTQPYRNGSPPARPSAPTFM